jgi:hypothetical protein
MTYSIFIFFFQEQGSYRTSGPYDKQVLIYKEAWPAPELEQEVERLFQASLDILSPAGGSIFFSSWRKVSSFNHS